MHLHFTPTSASWLHPVECWFARLTTRRLARGVFRSTRALEQAIENYIEVNNTDPKPLSVARYCHRTTESHHEVKRAWSEGRRRRGAKVCMRVGGSVTGAGLHHGTALRYASRVTPRAAPPPS